ncbi:hypothetical protein EX30DRAFT_248386 [Ascodesmis nigricans]|uniref:Uncharacterized protein n=1 Tax=Ascodesmis nigricans TaxID=341454 RepID=A0A4S2MI34_9PEZI|nr:hypothetical protein EX30DRAFT_248386 [Ascodesmis nigricans]
MGDHLGAHLQQFVPGGLYHRWIYDEVMRNWLVVDFRTTTAAKTCRRSHHSYRYFSTTTVYLTLMYLTDGDKLWSPIRHGRRGRSPHDS